MGTSLDWKSIDVAARSLGVGEYALEQWHTRGSVPHRWRLRLIREGGLALDTDFGSSKREAAET